MPNTEAIAVGDLQTAVAVGEREGGSRVYCHLGTEGVPFLTNPQLLFQIAEVLDHHSAIAQAILLFFFKMSKTHFFLISLLEETGPVFQKHSTQKNQPEADTWHEKNFARMLIVWQHFNKQMKTVCSNGNSAAVIATRSTKNNGLACQPRLTTNIVIVGN